MGRFLFEWNVRGKRQCKTVKKKGFLNNYFDITEINYSKMIADN